MHRNGSVHIAKSLLCKLLQSKCVITVDRFKLRSQQVFFNLFFTHMIFLKILILHKVPYYYMWWQIIYYSMYWLPYW